VSFNVQEFRSQLNLDGARPNLFHCELTFPALASVSGAQQRFTFMARAAQLPGSTINVVPQYYFGRELKFAGNRTFQEWTVTIVNDEDFTIRDSFERWMSGMNSHVSNLRNPAFLQGDGGYQSDGFITQQGKTGNIIKRYKFIGMFPVDITPIEMDWGANDTIEEYAVTFAYQWWEHAAGPNGPTTDTVGSSAPISPILPIIP
jgi:hypothetical protein